MPLTILSAGAAESFVRHLSADFEELGVEIEVTFGAVGVLQEAFLAGAPCDLLITSERGLGNLRSEGGLETDQVGDLGWVQTALAVRTGDSVPDVSTPEAVAQALADAPALFVPDPARSTAGGHIAQVLEQIGLGNAETLRVHPNGATAMRALAHGANRPGALGATQATEILQTSGIDLAGALPGRYALSTRYQCSLLPDHSQPEQAQRVFELLTGEHTASLRQRLGIGSAG